MPEIIEGYAIEATVENALDDGYRTHDIVKEAEKVIRKNDCGTLVVGEI